MIVAVAAVRMMQAAIDEIVHVVAVRHRRMTAAGAVHMTGVRGAHRRACVGIGRADRDAMFVHVVTVLVMQVPVVQIVHVVAVTDRRVPAARPVDVIVMRVVRLAAGHGALPGR